MRRLAFAILAGLTLGAAATHAQVYVVFPSCENDESLCASPAQAAAARERRERREAVEAQARMERQMKERAIEEKRKALEARLGAHRKAEIERLLALQQAAEANTARARAEVDARARKSCDAIAAQYRWIPCKCVGYIKPKVKGTACAM